MWPGFGRLGEGQNGDGDAGKMIRDPVVGRSEWRVKEC